MKEEEKWKAEDIVTLVFILIGIIVGIVACNSERRDNKKYGEKTYEFVIEDKYETLGSNWHLVGGRATETEYHIVYKTRLINRPDDEVSSHWMTQDKEVSYLTYKKYTVGQRFTDTDTWLPY